MLSHAGPITRTVSDSALLFDILSGPDARDHQALPASADSYLARCDQQLPTLRVAYCPTLFETPVHPEVAAGVEAAVNTLARQLPIELERLTLDWRDPLATFETLWVAGRGIAYGKTLGGRLDDLDPGFANLIEKARQYDLADYLAASQQRAMFANQVHALFDSYDLLLLPTLPILPFPAHLTGPEEGFETADSGTPWAR